MTYRWTRKVVSVFMILLTFIELTTRLFQQRFLHLALNFEPYSSYQNTPVRYSYRHRQWLQHDTVCSGWYKEGYKS